MSAAVGHAVGALRDALAQQTPFFLPMVLGLVALMGALLV